MKNILLLLLLTTTFTSFAQDHDARLDSVLANQEIILANQTEILADTGSEPLEGKKYGFEFDPALAMVSIGSGEALYLAGGFSMFDISRKAEVSIPFVFASYDNDNAIEIGGQYRRFLGRHQKGFWIGAGLTFRNLNYDSYYYGDYNPGRGNYDSGIKDYSIQQIGINFGIGVRIFSAGGFYWGTSISVGRYFGEEARGNPNIPFIFIEDNLLLDFEILKFGYAF